MNSSKEKYTQFIKAEAKRLGFMACGISKAGFLEEEAQTVSGNLVIDIPLVLRLITVTM